jgi:putative transposase
MSQKIEFVEKASKKRANIAALCREFGISRETGHKWLRAFKAEGFDGLEEKSRRPKSAPLATAEDIVSAIIEARDAHPRWGPRKLEAVLKRKLADATPSARTIARILKRFGRVRHRRKTRPLSIVDRAPAVVANAPNDVWTIDLKGCWRLEDGSRCGPLTVRDAFSRYVLAVVVLEHATAKAVRDALDRLFRKHGVPKAIQCDNGTPFICVRSRGGLSSLSAWWIALGIKLVRSRPAHPQDNGGHERMHADLAADVESNPASDRLAEQRACDRWRQEYNHVRPHEAIKQRTPAELYKPVRTKPAVRSAAYPRGWLTRRVVTNGDVIVNNEHYFISRSLAGYRVGLQPVGGIKYRVHFYELDLGEIEIFGDAVEAEIDRRARSHAR